MIMIFFLGWEIVDYDKPPLATQQFNSIHEIIKNIQQILFKLINLSIDNQNLCTLHWYIYMDKWSSVYNRDSLDGYQTVASQA